MQQKYTKPFMYKGVLVEPRPQNPAQYHPNTPQRVVPQRCQPVPYEPDCSGVGEAIGGIFGSIVKGFRAVSRDVKGETGYGKLRKQMAAIYASEREYQAGCRALDRKHRGRCAPSGQTQINVYGGVANITINNR